MKRASHARPDARAGQSRCLDREQQRNSAAAHQQQKFWKDDWQNIMVMMVSGPNYRPDYHDDPGEVLFIQWRMGGNIDRSSHYALRCARLVPVGLLHGSGLGGRHMDCRPTDRDGLEGQSWLSQKKFPRSD
jgi:hypothetical protein